MPSNLRANEPSARYSASGSQRPPQALPQKPLHTPESAAQALAVFFRIAQRWGLSATDKQSLLGASRTVFYRWQAGHVSTPLDATTAERLSYLFRIYAALQVLLPIDERADTWVHQHNSAALFGGGTALGHMLGGRVGDLKDVADFLDAQRGGDFA